MAGYKTWQKLGRQVRAGEHGIMIFAPCPWKREKETETGDTETEQGIYFRAVHVFDVAQTDGPDLPTVDVPPVDVAADRLRADLVSVTEQRGYRLSFEHIEDSRMGYATKDGQIVVESICSTGQQAKTLAHELAHEALHFGKHEALTRRIAELEAESVAYVVCRHFGLDVEVRASRYIALWNGDAKSLRDSLQRIADTARAMIDDVEGLGVRKAVA